jgi:hypothetical protein
MDPKDQIPTGSASGSFIRRFWAALRKHIAPEAEMDFYIFKAHPKTAVGWIIACTLACIVIAAGIAIPHFYSKWTGPSFKPSILVMCPDYRRASENAFYQDGVVQKKGFDTALIEADRLPGKLDVDFAYMNSDETAAELLKVMQERYSKEGRTFFVMTMSGKLLRLRAHFKRWHDDCVRNGQREPVLIGTVASAPEIADAPSGILRWYVRSEEESALLATYLRWKKGIDHAAVFYITQTAGQSNDPYGKKGMEVFRDRFVFSHSGLPIDAFGVTATSAKTEVEAFLAKYHKASAQTNDHTGVFIVGYGDMVRETLNQLIAQGFDGPIACASTLTEPDWQPRNTNADSRIVTVLPRTSDPQAKLRGDDRNCVFFFAKETLRRVMELTANDPGSRTFIERWKRDDTKGGLDQESLANGDSVVQLDVVGADLWR